MRLFLCEKPSQGRDIANSLGANQRKSGYYEGGGNVVTWCIGHLIEAAPPEAYNSDFKKWSLDTLPIVPDSWKMVVKKSTASQFKVVKSLLKTTTELVIATDGDRAGEQIARELIELCNYRGKIKRLWLSALNDASIQKALKNLKEGKETELMYHSALGRSRADWLIGMNLTRLFTLLGQKAGYQGVLSVGRVQTPTLKLVADRELQVRNFVPVPYWNLDVMLSAGGTPFVARWQCPEEFSDEAGRCIDQRKIGAAQQEINSAGQAILEQLNKKRQYEKPPLPYEMGELQKACSAKFDLGAQATLDATQALYENFKCVTYPRVDSQYLPENMHTEAPGILQAIAQSDDSLANLVSQSDPGIKSSAWNDSKVTAHHGIIPTAVVVDLSQLSTVEKKVYELIKLRYLAQFFPPHEFDKTDAVFNSAGYALKSSGKKVIDLGWRVTLISGEKDDVDLDEHEAEAEDKKTAHQELPELAEGQSYPAVDGKIKALKTKALPLYTEGTLIEAMKNVARFVTDQRLKATLRETTGIGTNTTRGGIIQALLDRKLMIKKGKRHLIAASEAHDLLAAIPSAISNPGTTAIWEQALDMIEAGELSLDDFVYKQSVWINGIVEKYRDQPINIKVTVEETPACELCGSPTRRRKGQYGDFYGCTNHPECKGIINIQQKKKTRRKATVNK